MLPVDIIIDMLYPKRGITITNVDKPKIKYHMRSKKQQIASQRNWNKMRILGIITNLETVRDAHITNSNTTNRWEKDCIEKSIENLEMVIEYWDKHTKKIIKDS